MPNTQAEIEEAQTEVSRIARIHATCRAEAAQFVASLMELSKSQPEAFAEYVRRHDDIDPIVTHGHIEGYRTEGVPLRYYVADENLRAHIVDLGHDRQKLCLARSR